MPHPLKLRLEVQESGGRESIRALPAMRILRLNPPVFD
jgi:hypothetical protein